MPTSVIMPALGLTQDTGKVLKWLKAEGDAVTQGEPLMEVETDKVTVEIEAPASGVLAAVRASAGDVVPVGQAVAVILAPGEPAPAPQAVEAKLPPASPKARRLAKDLGVDIATIAGTGPGGEVTAADVQAAKSNVAVPAADPSTEVSGVWKVMADRLVASWTTVPHFYLLREVDAGRLVTWRETFQTDGAAEITFTDLLVALTARALRDHPRLAARWEQGRIVSGDRIDVGLAVAIEDGLVVPIIRDADRLTVPEIAAARKELVERARAGRLRPDDIRGGTMTISNLGMYGVDAFYAIVNPPQAAILSVGRIADRVVAAAGSPAVRPMLTVSLSCDHRVVDGARGAQFLDTLAGLIARAGDV